MAATFGGSVSALQCMCSVDRVIHYTVVTLCGKRDAWRGRRQVSAAGTPALGDGHPVLHIVALRS